MMLKIVQNLLHKISKFWKFVWYGDSFLSYVAFFLLTIIFLNLAYPATFFVLSKTVGISDAVAVVTGSMIHDETINVTYYEYMRAEKGITKEELDTFPFQSGLNIGDLIVVWNPDPEKINVGNVIIFDVSGVMIIHRVIEKQFIDGEWFFTTKGDHNTGSMVTEININSERIIGVAGQRIPFLGIPKTILTRVIMGVNNVL